MLKQREFDRKNIEYAAYMGRFYVGRDIFITPRFIKFAGKRHVEDNAPTI